MKFWIDTEYDDSGDRPVLISLGAVAEDGREFYAVSAEFDADCVKPFVRENVLPYLPPRASPDWMPLSRISDAFLGFIGEDQAEFWSLIATYDWFLVTNELLGGLDNLPSNWNFECWDLYQWAWRIGASKVYPQLQPVFEDTDEHHALSCARLHRRIYDYLAQYERDHKSSD